MLASDDGRSVQQRVDARQTYNLCLGPGNYRAKKSRLAIRQFWINVMPDRTGVIVATHLPHCPRVFNRLPHSLDEGDEIDLTNLASFGKDLRSAHTKPKEAVRETVSALGFGEVAA